MTLQTLSSDFSSTLFHFLSSNKNCLMLIFDVDPTKERPKIRHTSVVGLLVLIVLARCLRTITLYKSFDFLLVQRFPVLLFLFCSLGGVSIVFSLIYRPFVWSRHEKFNFKHWIVLSVYGAVLVLNVLCWTVALKYYGPLKTLLSSEYADTVLLFLFAVLSNTRAQSPRKVRGAVCLLTGYALLYLFGSSATSLSLSQIHSLTLPSASQWLSNKLSNQNVTLWLLKPASSTDFKLGVWSISNETVGCVSLFISVCLTIIRKRLLRKLHPMFGNSKRMFTFGLLSATALLMPFAAFQFFTTPALKEMSFLSVFLPILIVIVSLIVGDYYIEFVAAAHLKRSYLTTASLTTCFVCGILLSELWAESELCFSTFLAFFFLLLGFRLIFAEQTNAAIATTPILPLSGAVTVTLSSSSLFHILRNTLKTILKNRDSRKIFIFLTINLSFMFVELIYGFWTNSLGLISDAFHMLFDCTALAIGLYAAVISKWEPNRIFTYGYGRVEVLSGFVNGVFLCFIAMSIMIKSLERLIEPPEIKTERLLLVSVLGFFVNLIGVFAFHSDMFFCGTKTKKAKKPHYDKKDDNAQTSLKSTLESPSELQSDSQHHHRKEENIISSRERDSHTYTHHPHHRHHHHHHNHSEDDHHAHSENLHGIFLHILADTLGSVGVITSSVLIWLYDWKIVDPICSLCIAMLIFMSVVRLLKSSAKTLLQRTPEYFEGTLKQCLEEVRGFDCVIVIVIACARSSVHFATCV
jgi:zinc transporter 5/7